VRFIVRRDLWFFPRAQGCAIRRLEAESIDGRIFFSINANKTTFSLDFSFFITYIFANSISFQKKGRIFMDLKKFTFKGKSATPRISIRKGGQIGLNMASISKFNLKKFSHAVLYIDEEEKVIGIEPVIRKDIDGAHRLRISDMGGTISAKNFIVTYELNKKIEKSLICEWDEELKMMLAKY
jgi:hypothetical protein